VDRALRRLGQLLVVMGALLGAVLGVSLALIVDRLETSGMVVAPGREGAAVLSASSPGSQPPGSRGARSEDSAAGGGSSANQRAESAGRADQRDSKAGKNREGRRDKPGRGKDKPGKGKDK
jgi:hypothetical protein